MGKGGLGDFEVKFFEYKKRERKKKRKRKEKRKKIVSISAKKIIKCHISISSGFLGLMKSFQCFHFWEDIPLSLACEYVGTASFESLVFAAHHHPRTFMCLSWLFLPSTPTFFLDFGATQVMASPSW